MKEHTINKINLYERVLRKGNIVDKSDQSLLSEAIGLDETEIANDRAEIENLNSIYKQLKRELNSLKTKDDKSLKQAEIDEVLAECWDHYKAFESKLLKASGAKELSDLENPDFIRELIERIGVKVAHNMHSRVFNDTFKAVNSDKKLVELFTAELEENHLSYKIFKALNKALLTQDQDLYDKVSKIILRDFKKNISKDLISDNATLETVIISCLVGERVLINTHKNFDLKRSQIIHPEIFLFKALLSKALNH